ncbi:thioredoxin family protein [Anoxybacillus sp. J5B_2022]|uniref:thioredoxin family protein n=1 Tax=Anoxybacillus sp. J5B_2022 TaxID=3003246 RepID=UPI002286437B|nr:thioredoxin family protein [Anoxybacillus sp. J5B_2022]MCZ0756585.1 thioredoxin family protein [Anoxybacillus sp. J5B_2022]
MQEVTVKQIDEWIQQQEIVCLYVYTPMCGTCQLAKRMLDVVEQLFPDIPFYRADINYMPERAEEWQIESVPCLLLFQNGSQKKKIYAFHSVPYLYEVIQKFQEHRHR